MRWRIEQPQFDPAKLVFVDESGASTKMARLYGRAKRGRRVVGRVPWGHWKTVTFVAGLRLDGFTAPFDPIELSFAKLKANLRKAKERSIPALYDRIGLALDTFHASEFRNYFRKSGYAPT